jgi:hypothetical protein
MTITNGADLTIRRALRDAGAEASVDLALIDGRTVTGTVVAEEHHYVVAGAGKDWIVPSGHVVAVAVPS